MLNVHIIRVYEVVYAHILGFMEFFAYLCKR